MDRVLVVDDDQPTRHLVSLCEDSPQQSEGTRLIDPLVH